VRIENRYIPLRIQSTNTEGVRARLFITRLLACILLDMYSPQTYNSQLSQLFWLAQIGVMVEMILAGNIRQIPLGISPN
jgi:hypothetical protein